MRISEIEIDGKTVFWLMAGILVWIDPSGLSALLSLIQAIE